MSMVPSFSPEEYGRQDHTEHLLGRRGILARVTFASGTVMERKYELLNDDPITTRGYAIGDLVALHTSQHSDTLDVDAYRDPSDVTGHHVDLNLADDPLVEVHIENVRIPNHG
jgi:hypothetical protein